MTLNLNSGEQITQLNKLKQPSTFLSFLCRTQPVTCIYPTLNSPFIPYNHRIFTQHSTVYLSHTITVYLPSTQHTIYPIQSPYIYPALNSLFIPYNHRIFTQHSIVYLSHTITVYLPSTEVLTVSSRNGYATWTSISPMQIKHISSQDKLPSFT